MNVESQNILDRALKLSDSDKAIIIDQLRASLDQRYEAIDAKWGREAEQRVEDYNAGRLRSVSMEQLLPKYD
jgi:hypothetical protein